MFSRHYIDSENLLGDISKLELAVQAVLKQEFQSEINRGKTFIRLDKMGKIGEYIFSCLLYDYFNFDCIIPKVHLQTDYNMSIYGIDTLYYSTINDLLLFGESKMSLSLDNGIKLINSSLKGYEKQLEDEFLLVLSNRLYKDKLNQFDGKYGDIAELCISIQDFIKDANIKQLGVPIFIAHGTDIHQDKILKKLQKVKCRDLLGLKTIYYLISLPIIDKNKLVAIFTEMIRGREEHYEKLTK